MVSRVSGQNGIPRLYNMLSIHHSGPEPSLYRLRLERIKCLWLKCVGGLWLLKFVSLWLETVAVRDWRRLEPMAEEVWKHVFGRKKAPVVGEGCEPLVGKS